MSRKVRGVLYSVKVGNANGSVYTIFSQALQGAFALEGKKVPDELAERIAYLLIDELGIRPSAQSIDPTREHYNSIIRAGNAVGIPMTHELEKMLKEAKAKSKDSDVARGRMRGLAQALAFVRSPQTYLTTTPKKRLSLIQREEAK